MKKILLLTFCTVCLSTALLSQTVNKELRHVVLFGWKDKADSASISKAVAAFRKLPDEIKTIHKFEWGTNNSPEKLNNGLTHCFLLSFASEKDRDDYLVHPSHKAFTALLPDILDKVTVLDYWAQQ
ncbi:MAG: Dabb family protein [Bacteroidota bacterium]